LVNNKSLLKPGLFKLARPYKFVECRSSSLLITNKEKRVIKSILNIVSQNANDRGWLVVIKTRLTTKRKKKYKRRGDYIYIARG
jgi:hypothetical protein